jgi:signal transduction histidine kinase
MYEMNERLVRMVNNMLNVSRIEKGRIEFKIEPTDVTDVIKCAIDNLELKARERGLELSFKIPAKSLPPVMADADKLCEVILNVTDNALKYTQKGSVRFSVTEDRKGKRVLIRIKDTGVGMDPEDAKHVFDKFYRAKSTAAPQEGGAGLGLYIVVKFLQRMGGDIRVEKTGRGKGTTVLIRLKAAPNKGMTAK